MAKDIQAASLKWKEESVETRKTEFLSRLQNRPTSSINVTVDANASDYVIGESVTGGTSSATGDVKQIISSKECVVLENVTGTFVDAEVITGGTSGTTANSVIK